MHLRAEKKLSMVHEEQKCPNNVDEKRPWLLIIMMRSKMSRLCKGRVQDDVILREPDYCDGGEYQLSVVRFWNMHLYITRGDPTHTRSKRMLVFVNSWMPLVPIALRNFVINRARIIGAYLKFFSEEIGCIWAKWPLRNEAVWSWVLIFRTNMQISAKCVPFYASP